MNIQIERHKLLITKRVVFTHRVYPPPPKISRRMEFGSKFRKHPAIENNANVVHATTPSSMDINEVTPVSTQSSLLTVVPPLYVDQYDRSKTRRGGTPKRFSTAAGTLSAENDQTGQAMENINTDVSVFVKSRPAVRFSERDNDSLSTVSSVNDAEVLAA